MNPQEAPRVVSKTRYLRYLSQKAVLWAAGTSLFLLGVMGVMACVGALIACLTLANPYPLWSIPNIGVSVVCLLPVALCVLLARSGISQMDRAERLEPLVPLTRQNAEQLPAEQSLVRASSEPAEQQQAVLLRAAGSDTQTPAHELLRATTQEGKS
jgi:hypothetical protein